MILKHKATEAQRHGEEKANKYYIDFVSLCLRVSVVQYLAANSL